MLANNEQTCMMFFHVLQHRVMIDKDTIAEQALDVLWF
jgi:hypothetical protein